MIGSDVEMKVYDRMVGIMGIYVKTNAILKPSPELSHCIGLRSVRGSRRSLISIRFSTYSLKSR